MSDTIWLQVDDGGEPVGGERDISLTLKLCDELDAISVRAGAPKLSSFFDSSSLAEFYAGEIGEEEVPPVEPTWSDASDGLAAVDAVLEVLRGSGMDQLKLDGPRSHWPEMLIAELEYCREKLSKAAEQGKRFRFLIVA